MPKFKSIPHEVTAVQWKGEITPDLRALFGPRPMAVNTDLLGLLRPTLVVPQEGDQLAAVGDWVVRTDYEFKAAVDHGDPEPVFDLDVMEPDDFSETYEPESGAPGGVEFNIAVPAILTSASGEAPTDIRVRLAVGRPSPDIIAMVAAQLVPHLEGRSAVVGCVQALCIHLDLDTLIAVRDTVERLMVAKSPLH